MSVTAPKRETKKRTATRKKPAPKKERPWAVVVLNDPVNLMSYVVLVFRRVLGFSEPVARKHMLEVHKAGRSVVWQGEREQAEGYVQTLQTWQLTAILEHGKASGD